MTEVRRIDLEQPGELERALLTVGRVFDEFVAPGYLPEGVEEFYRFISPDSLGKALASDERQMWVALVDGSIAGIIALRSENHICLFFVDSAFHGQGVGRALYDAVLVHLRAIGREFVTVYSSQYAVHVYEHLGFTKVCEETLVRGMYSTPMCAYIFLGE